MASAIPAFPGAEGFGANATGGRSGDVYHVTSLADTNTVGTLRYGISSAPTSGRTILFDVAGTITLTSNLNVNKSKVTIAGQSAPGQGICLRNYNFAISGNDVIVRDIRSRLGIDANQESDSFSVTGGTNVMVDHCSASWSVDETLSPTNNTKTLTVQWTYITDSLNKSIHSKGPHGYGSLIRPSVSSQITFSHDLYANHSSRNPRPGTYNGGPLVLDFRNNVIYNWGNQAGYSGDNDPNTAFHENVHMNYVGNYLVAGPSTSSSKLTNAFDGGGTYTQIYQSGNFIDGDRDGVFDGTNTGWGMFSGTYTAMSGSFDCAPVYTEVAGTALQRVINEAGAFAWNRDGVDTRVTNMVRSAGTSGAIIDTVQQGGGWALAVPAGGTYTLSYDTDRDGMPDTWEIAHGLDPSVASNNGDYDVDGYTNLEEYLNELVPIPAPKAIVWADAGGSTAGRYEVITNWDIPWQPSLYDRAEINSGKATVAYIGQQAGTLTVGNTASSNGELAVTGGSLALANRLILGNATSARGTATLSGGSLTAGGPIVLASSSSSTGLLKVSKGAYVQVGGLTINTGSGRSTQVGVEVASDGCSLIRTTATSTLGGAMDAQSLSGFRPKEGDKFVVISSTDPSGVHFTGNFTSFTSNILLGLPGGSAFGGSADGANYEVVFLGYTFGDADGNHKVDGGDLALMGGAWGQSGKAWGDLRLHRRRGGGWRGPGLAGRQLDVGLARRRRPCPSQSRPRLPCSPWAPRPSPIARGADGGI